MSDLYRCDRCKEIKEPPPALECRQSAKVLFVDEPYMYQLCAQCKKAFRTWLARGVGSEEAADGE